MFDKRGSSFNFISEVFAFISSILLRITLSDLVSELMPSLNDFSIPLTNSNALLNSAVTKSVFK